MAFELLKKWKHAFILYFRLIFYMRTVKAWINVMFAILKANE